jgi:pyridoxine 5-phosphate synthase
MAEDDSLAPAGHVLVPRAEALSRRRVDVGVRLDAFRCTPADAGREVDVRVRRFGIEVRKRSPGIGPGRMQSRMDEDEPRPGFDEGPGPEPPQELLTIGGLEDRRQRIAMSQFAGAPTSGEEMKIMVAENAAGVQRLEKPKRAERIGSPVHQIADRLERVTRGIEIERGKQALQLVEASLNIANEDPSCHVGGGYTGLHGRGPFRSAGRIIVIAMPIALSVNLNKVALLRNSRGGNNPSPRVAAETCIDEGASGITLHWREDERHTRASDVRDLRALCRERGVEFNLEGDLRGALIDLACDVRVDQCTLVPVTPGEITSDRGFVLPQETAQIMPTLARLNDRGIRTSIFMDANPGTIEEAAKTGARRIEIYTGPYAEAHGTGRAEAEFVRVRDTARAAAAHGLGVNAGHDLDLRNLPRLAREVPEINEVSIGHALLADALYLGLPETIRRYVAACHGERVDAPKTR